MRSCRTTFSTVQFNVTSNFLHVTSKTPYFEAPHPLIRGWGLYTVALFVLLLMLCQGCLSALECTVQEWDPTPWYLDFNQSHASTDECLMVTESSIGEICESSNSNRLMKMRKTSTSFCGLPLINVLSEQDKHNVIKCAKHNGCYNSLKFVDNLDKNLNCMYRSFEELLDRRACANYSMRGTCDKCKVSGILMKLVLP